MTTYRIKGTWIEPHACDCDRCSGWDDYHSINVVVTTSSDEAVATSKALCQAGFDVSYGKWRKGDPLIKHLGEDELMRMRGESELPEMEAYRLSQGRLDRLP